MDITFSHIEQYLREVKKSVRQNQFRIELNENRTENKDLFFRYNLSRDGSKQILLSLSPYDFSEIRKNNHTGYEEELLYVFGKEVVLTDRYKMEPELVPLYIKINKLDNQFIIVISFHVQNYKMKMFFK